MKSSELYPYDKGKDGERKYGHKEMRAEKVLRVFSNCEHQFVPIEGKVCVADIIGKHDITLSKINR
ncbi:MAG: GTP cyclohydrolase I [Crocinitomicaceae bacterium]|nr:GTP cyclohydrolase I [Crocinitomicaceae bacterium]